MPENNPIAHLIPSDPLMALAWRDALAWAASEPEAIAAFTEATGVRWTPAPTPLDRMIDDATGANEAVFVRFVEWFNDIVWGPLDIVAGEPTPKRRSRRHA